LNPETSLVTFEDWTLRIRTPAGQGKRILLMLHGWQGDENSMWVFARNFPADCWIVAPRAPYTAHEGGYTWRAPGSGKYPSIDNLRASTQALIGLLDSWAQANGLDAARVDVTGFSQGAAMTCMFGLLYPQRVGKMGILSGFAPKDAEPIFVPGHFTGKKVFVAHGTKDEMVPIEQARRTIALFEQAGAQVIYCESEVAHKLSAECLKALERYLSG
jgi:phospholipase/carboxylesterase